MRRLLFLLLAASASLAVGQDTAAIEKNILQLEQDWTDSGIKKDLKTIDRIVADDWIGLDYLGKRVTKVQMMANYKSGNSTNQTITLADMKVRAFGNTAIVTGSDVEKSTYNGKDSSGKYVWTDVFVNRNGTWQAVASHNTKL